MPLYELGAIELRADAIEEIKDVDDKLAEVRKLLSNISDTERIAARISTFRASPRDLVALAATLRQIPLLRGILQQFSADLLVRLAGQCDSMDELAELLESAIKPEPPTHLRDGGVIKTGFSEELDRLRSISKDGQSWLRNYQKGEIERTGIGNLKIGYNKVFGYYIEINHSSADKVPADYVRKQTIKNAERYITEKLKEYETPADLVKNDKRFIGGVVDNVGHFGHFDHKG
ncbi:DNA mismatch repair protein MutS [subsurface metagenome]